MLRRLVAGLAWFTIAAPAAAQEFPRYDVDALCDRFARGAASNSAIVLQWCIDGEQSAYDALKSQWSAVPEARRQECLFIQRLLGPGSYSDLNQCAKKDGSTSGSAPKPRFRY